MSKPFYTINIRDDQSIDCFDEQELLSNISKIKGTETANIFKYKYTKEGKQLDMAVTPHVGFLRKKDLLRWAQTELTHAPNRTEQETEENYTVSISYPKDEEARRIL